MTLHTTCSTHRRRQRTHSHDEHSAREVTGATAHTGEVRGQPPPCKRGTAKATLPPKAPRLPAGGLAEGTTQTSASAVLGGPTVA